MKKISPYLGIYRAVAIILMLVAIAYATFNFFQYQDAARQLVLDNRPTTYTSKELIYRNSGTIVTDKDGNEIKTPTTIVTEDQIIKENYRNSDLTLAELDVLWQKNLYAEIIGGTITFAFALLAIVASLFALNSKRQAAILSTIAIGFVFIANQATLFVANGLYGYGLYQRYFFNFLEFIFIIVLIGLTIFTIISNPQFKKIIVPEADSRNQSRK